MRRRDGVEELQSARGRRQRKRSGGRSSGGGRVERLHVERTHRVEQQPRGPLHAAGVGRILRRVLTMDGAQGFVLGRCRGRPGGDGRTEAGRAQHHRISLHEGDEGPRCRSGAVHREDGRLSRVSHPLPCGHDIQGRCRYHGHGHRRQHLHGHVHLPPVRLVLEDGPQGQGIHPGMEPRARLHDGRLGIVGRLRSAVDRLRVDVLPRHPRRGHVARGLGVDRLDEVLQRRSFGGRRFPQTHCVE